MPKFTCHVIMKRGLETIEFAPGDELPSWAVGQVGTHVLTAGDSIPDADPNESDAGHSGEDADPDSGTESDSDDGSAEGDADAATEATATASADSAPDFTKPAPVKRGRPRKQD